MSLGEGEVRLCPDGDDEVFGDLWVGQAEPAFGGTQGGFAFRGSRRAVGLVGAVADVVLYEIYKRRKVCQLGARGDGRRFPVSR